MTNPETAVTVIEQTPDAVVEWNLDNWPTDQFNRVIPTQAIGIANEFIRPVIAVVQLDLETDTYESKDLKSGHRAPNARGLAKLADAAGVSFIDEVRVDDGSNPLRAHVKVAVEMVDPTGMKRRATGGRDYDLSSQPMTEAQRARAKGFIYELAQTRARHRALRLLLSLAQSYTVADLRKPFAVVRYLPNTQHPEVREIYKGALAASVGALFGPGPAAPQLAAGPVLTDEHLDDEPVVETPRQLAPGRASGAAAPVVVPDTAPQAPGAPAAPGALEEPSWMRDVPGGAGVEEAATREPGIRDIVAERLADEGQPKGPVNGKQQDMLKGIFSAFPEDERGALYAAGIRALFEVTWKDLTCAQARAIGMAHDELGAQAFAAAWRELAS